MKKIPSSSSPPPPHAQVHLAFAGARTDGTPDGMSVMWYTDKDTATSVVQFGPASSGGGALPFNASALAPAVQYIKDYGFHHTVELVGLVASTKYSYRVGDTATGSWSDVHAFTAADAADAVSYPFGVSIYGTYCCVLRTDVSLCLGQSTLESICTAYFEFSGARGFGLP